MNNIKMAANMNEYLEKETLTSEHEKMCHFISIK